MKIIKDFETFDRFQVNYLEKFHYIKKLSSGLYIYMSKGLKIIKKMKFILRQILNEFNIKEILLPSLVKASFFQNRINSWSNNLFLTKDNYLLSPTSEEIMNYLAKEFIISYKQLPLHIFQISNKFRKEKSTYSIYRTQEFLMKDSYSFHINDIQELNEWNKIISIYKEFFRIMQLNDFVLSKEFKEDKQMKSSLNLEFLIKHKIGEEKLKFCNICKNFTNKKKCCNIEVRFYNFVEIAHLFHLKDYYSKKNNFMIKNENNVNKYITMNSYGIGLSRLLLIIYEMYKDDYGISLPDNIVAENVRIIPASNDSLKDSLFIYEKCSYIWQNNSINKFCSNTDINIDLRKNHGLGYKIKDSIANGVLITVVVGKKYGNKIEIFFRNDFPSKKIISQNQFYDFVLKNRLNLY